MKSKVKETTKSIIITIVIIICILLIIISLSKIINWKKDIDQSHSIKQDINKYVEKKEDAYSIDFKHLKEKNPDTVAYLKVNNTKIDYIVVKGNDNNYYLTHNFKKQYSVTGWVFATYQNKMDGQDQNIVIFGHNMRDGSMFGTLKNILKKKWYNNKENLNIKLVTEQGTYNYQVFSIYQTPAEDYYIQTDFSDDEFSNFLKEIKKRSIKNFNIDVNKKDKILTLSTCSMTGKERVVLHAKRI